MPSTNVALKILSAELARDTDYVARFKQEATTAAQLEHPHIVPIYDVGQADGRLYIAMRYVGGGSLAESIRQRGSLPLDRALRLLEQVADALDYAHARGVVHRDLKPANILLEAGVDRASLADFGIAKAADGGTRLTRLGSIAGTPEYMAPEHVQRGSADFRADLYALGIIAYELLAGRAPFEADSGIVVLHQQVYDPPPPLRRLRPDLPAWVEDAIMQMLAKRPEERFQTATAFVAALGAQPAPVHSGNVSPRPIPLAGAPRTPNGAGRGMGWATPLAAAAGALGIGAAIVVLAASGSRPNPPEQVAAPPPSATALPTHTPAPVVTAAPAPTQVPTFAPFVATPTAAPARPVLAASDVSPRSVRPGEAVTLSYEINNPGSVPVEAILGATLRERGGGPDLNDPTDDQPATVQPGKGTYTRVFGVPAGAVDGSYDVLWGVMSRDRELSYGLQTGSATLQISRPPTALVPTPPPAAAVALPGINEGNRVWAAVVARGGDPVSNLASVYGGRWLETVRAEVEAMRSRGQYRVARLVAPVTLRSATYTSAERIEAFTSEQWEDRLYNGDGSVARVAPGHVEQRYVLQRVGGGWLIVDSELERSS